MIATLRQNALPIAMILVCAAALYLVYRDMKKIDARLNRLDAAVVVLAEEHAALEDGALDAVCDYDAALEAEAAEESENEFELVADFAVGADAADAEPEAVDAEPEAVDAEAVEPVEA